jgi:2-succinyl-5-enolpyruvyl-6-hydroxy-3-cyclohexene-1-carboxylate synthase
MTQPDEDVQAAFCAVLVDEWARAGVTEAVVAPGSRSTPLVVALDASERIRVHVVLDERSAGFVAVGLGSATDRPAVVVTTSGTAAVELHPAVVEAAHAAVPLIAVTTDRPPDLHSVGAPQTVDQEGLFGSAVRWAVSPGVADEAAAWSWRSMAARCVVEAIEGQGPVQVNLAFREPLIGVAGKVAVPGGRPDGAPWHVWSPSSGVYGGPFCSGSRGLVIAGHGAGGPELVRAASRLGWPVLADPRSGCRIPSDQVVAAADALLRTAKVAQWQPDVVVRAGAPWASKVLNQWLGSLPPDVPQVFVDQLGRWADPERKATRVVRADPVAFLAACSSTTPSQWPAQWAAAEAAAQRALDGCLGPGAALALSEPAVARAVVAGLPEDAHLVVASSMPVRDVEWYSAPRSGVAVHANRGANGIDGVLSTAMGSSLASGEPTVALVGDLAFLHDAGALLWSAQRDLRLTVVIVDNDGGGIFSFLPQATALSSSLFERYWGTPHGLSLPAIARAYGVEALEVKSRDDLSVVLSDAAKPGVRVAVVRSDRAANVEAHDALNKAVAAVVERDQLL